MTTRTYHGSCHRGAIRFQCDIDLASGTGRCNCTYCGKMRSWGVLVKPGSFHLIAGEGAVSEYQFDTRQGHHVFCRHCGVRPYGYGHVEEIGGDFVSVQIACLDDASVEELVAAPITYQDGRNNAWWNVPAEIRHL